jgi:DNA-binding PadR family transcriptional regulator
MSVTRMLVLGAVRIFQPTHGYFVRRELGTWQVAEWAHLNPGSIYNALRVLTRDGMLHEEEPDATESAVAATGSRGSGKTKYRLTVDGEQEFVRLVREAVWELHPYEPDWLFAGISFWGVLSRDEVLAAFAARTALIQARISGSRYTSAGLPESAGGTPDNILETFRFHESQLEAELRWLAGAVDRIGAGEYGFLGEDPDRLRPRLHPLQPRPLD